MTNKAKSHAVCFSTLGAKNRGTSTWSIAVYISTLSLSSSVRILQASCHTSPPLPLLFHLFPFAMTETCVKPDCTRRSGVRPLQGDMAANHNRVCFSKQRVVASASANMTWGVCRGANNQKALLCKYIKY